MNTGARIYLRECAPFSLTLFMRLFARWPLNVEATIRAAGIGKVLANRFVLTPSPVVGILTGVFLKLLPPKKMKPKRKKIIRAKDLFLQEREEEAPPMHYKDEERDGFTPYPMKFHSNRWAEKLGQ